MNAYPNRKASGYLRSLRRRSYARDYCRKLIRERVNSGMIASIMDAGYGGGNERIMLHNLFISHPALKFIGCDNRKECIEVGRARWPEHDWRIVNLDIPPDPIFADIVYCQHVLEHCADLQPGFDWLLSCANQILLVIFFIPLGGIAIRKRRRCIWSNQYTRHQVVEACEKSQFNCQFIDFDNRDRVNGHRGVHFETVLHAERR